MYITIQALSNLFFEKAYLCYFIPDKLYKNHTFLAIHLAKLTDLRYNLTK